MRLQHMVRMAQGYTDGRVEPGEVEFVFREVKGEVTTTLQVSVSRNPHQNWLVVAEAYKGDEEYVKSLRGHHLNAMFDEIIRGLPPWCHI